MNSRRSWLVVGVGIFAYMIAILQRTTLGVAGVAAVDRFDVTASALSAMAVMQLIVYAGAQVPVGILIDRWGPRILVLAGMTLVTIGQVVVAFAPVISVAVLGRILLGAGDAAIFVSAIRLVSSWFTGRIVPQLSQWVGNIGQVGQVLSAVPFAFVLNLYGWTVAFLAAGSLALLALVLAIACIADRPGGSPEPNRADTWAEALRQLRSSFKRPGTRLGFWSHFVTQSSATVFALLWGFPFLVYALGYTESEAAMMLLLLVVSALVFGPVIGILTARFPYRRSNLILTIVVAMAVVWTAVLLWPGGPPVWLMIVLLIVIGIGGPGSVIGFDFARSFNPLHVLGSANGVVNVGGFLASFTMMFLMGWILDLLSGGGANPAELYTLDAFRVAFCVQYLVIGFGVAMLLIARRKTRRVIEEDEGIQVGPLWVALVDLIRRRR